MSNKYMLLVFDININIPMPTGITAAHVCIGILDGQTIISVVINFTRLHLINLINGYNKF